VTFGTSHSDSSFADAERWDAEYDTRSAHGHWWNARLLGALELVGDGPGALLEVGPGPGRLLAKLAAAGWTVTALDVSPAMVELARRRVPAAAERIVTGRAEELPFADAVFDVVVAVGVLRYTELQRSLAELARVLRPAGRAVVGFQNARAPTTLWRRAVVLPAARAAKRVAPVGRPLPQRRAGPPSPARARELLASMSLEIERVEYVSCSVLPDPLDRIAPGVAYRAARAAERSAALRRVLGTQRLYAAVKR
jgi:SAM-dependent methyltransferase